MEKNKNSFQKLISKLKDGTFKEVLEDWKWIMKYSARYKGAIAFYVFLGVFSTSFGIVSTVAGKYMIDIITGHETSKFILMAVIMVGGSLFSIFFSNMIGRVSYKLTLGISQDIEADIFDKIMDADWLSMNKYSYGDILNRFNNDVSTVSSNAISWLPTVIISGYTFIATFIVIFYYDKIMAFIALGSAPFLALISKFVVKKQREYSKKVREIGSDIMSFEVETFYNYDSIKSFGIIAYYCRKLRSWQGKYKELGLKYNMFTIFTNIILSAIGLLVELIAFGYCLFRLWSGNITFGTMTLFLQQRSSLSVSFNKVVGLVPNFLNASVSAHRVRELVELPKEVHVPESCKMDKYIDEGFEVSMEGVDFCYKEGENIIEKSKLVARPGEIIALVGPSGEGKTTIIRLILGLVRPNEGTVSLKVSNGERAVMNAETRHLFAYVPQGNTILAGTIKENMKLVKEDATDDEIIEALKTACAWDFVEKLDGGIEYNVGERGRGLSDGQNQRIAIARAILRDAPILLLDEATSALDVETERNVLRNIIKVKPNKTCIVTTHRPSVLTMCKRVYRVIDKNVVELDKEESAKMAMDF